MPVGQKRRPSSLWEKAFALRANFLPEVDIECYGYAEDDCCVDNIPVGCGNLFWRRGAEYQL